MMCQVKRLGDFDGEWDLVTYIRMSANRLNDGVIKVPRITEEITSNVVCVLDTFEDVGSDGKLRSFSELGPLILTLEVNVLDPALVLSCGGLQE